MKILGVIVSGKKSPTKVQPGEYSKGGGSEDKLHNCERHPDDSSNIAYVYWNDDRWVLDWNWTENNWNGDERLGSYAIVGIV